MTKNKELNNTSTAIPFLVAQFSDTKTLSNFKKTCKSLQNNAKLDEELNNQTRLQNAMKKIVQSDSSKLISYWFVASNISLLISFEGLSAIHESDNSNQCNINKEIIGLMLLLSISSLVLLSLFCAQNELTDAKIKRLFDITDINQEESPQEENTNEDNGLSKFKISHNDKEFILTFTKSNNVSSDNDLKDINSCNPESIKIN